MKSVACINWRRDLGVNLDMLNSEIPQGRNKFYWEILKEVQGRRCLEIGFGTGILSIIAIQHGAVHVEAWEQNLHLYQLGCHIIKELQLQDRITLHHGMYDKSRCRDPSLLVIHEIIGADIWCEGMYQALPVGQNLVLPSTYSIRFDVIAINRVKFNNEFYPKREFLPRVPVSTEFQQLLQGLIDQSPELVNQRSYYSDPVLEQLNFYNININNIKLLPATIVQTYDLSRYPVDDVLLFYPFATVAHNDHVLPWSWSDPIAITSHTGKISIAQDLASGKFYVEENK